MTHDSAQTEPVDSLPTSRTSSHGVGALPARIVILAWCVLTAVLVVRNPTALGRIGVASNVLFLTTGSAFAVAFVHARRGEYRVLAGIVGLSLSLASLVIASMAFLLSHAWTPTRVGVTIIIETAVIACLPLFSFGAPSDIASDDPEHRPVDAAGQPTTAGQPASAAAATATTPVADTR